MIRVNRYYSGTDGNMDADPKWYVVDWEDFSNQSEHKYDDMHFSVMTSDGNTPFILRVDDKFRTFISKVYESGIQLTYFWVNADSQEEIIKFIKDGNIEVKEYGK